MEPNKPAGSAPHKNTLMAVLSYLGPLVIVSYIVANKDPFVKFHIKQGLVLLLANLIVWFGLRLSWMFWPLWQIVNLGILILAIMGIINAVKGVEKELPIVGKFADNFKI